MSTNERAGFKIQRYLRKLRADEHHRLRFVLKFGSTQYLVLDSGSGSTKSVY